MSIESGKAFLERVKNDEDFRKEMGEKTSVEERLEFVKVNGFEFSKEELNEVKSELSDAELDCVAGGCGCWSRDIVYM